MTNNPTAALTCVCGDSIEAHDKVFETPLTCSKCGCLVFTPQPPPAAPDAVRDDYIDPNKNLWLDALDFLKQAGHHESFCTETVAGMVMEFALQKVTPLRDELAEVVRERDKSRRRMNDNKSDSKFIRETTALLRKEKAKEQAGHAKLVDVRLCQRCGENHDELGFDPLSNPADEYSWFAKCPITQQPILLKIQALKQSGDGGAK